MRKESFQGILLGIVIMCAVFAFITVAWAALSSSLTINGQATVAAQSWDVGFNSSAAAYTTATTAPCTAGGASGSATCPSGNSVALVKDQFGGNNVSLGTLNAPGGTLSYTWYIVNNGTFDATVTNITNMKSGSCSGEGECEITLSCETTNSETYADINTYCGGISAKLKFGESAASLNTVVGKKSGGSVTTQAVTLIISFDEIPSSLTTLPENPVTVTLSSGITLGYQQAGSGS